MSVAILNTADEVRAHAVAVQRRINASRRAKPVVVARLPAPAAIVKEIAPPIDPRGMGEALRIIKSEIAPPRGNQHGYDTERPFYCYVRLQAILDAVAAETEMEISEFACRCRKKRYVYARHVYFYAAYKLTNHSYSKMGGNLGLDHSTSVHAVQKMKQILAKGEPPTDLARAVFERLGHKL